MNIDVAGRIRPSVRADGRKNVYIDGQNRVGSGPQGPFFNFKQLHREDASTYDVFRASVEPLLSLFVSGINCCLLLLGESGAGKTYTVTGHGSSRVGLLPLLLENLFTLIADGHQNRYQTPKVTIQMSEVYNDTVKDLLQASGITSSYVELDMSAELGVHIKGGNVIPIRSAEDGVRLFRQGWANRTEGMTDYGLAQKNASIVIHIQLEIVGDSPDIHRCTFTVAEIGGLEKIAQDVKTLRTREASSLNKGIVALSKVVQKLSRNAQPARVISYNESKLTQLLQQEVGGNCRTNAVMCMKPGVEPALMDHIVQFCSHLSHIHTFPITNDHLGQSLETQYRSQVLDLRQQLGLGSTYSARPNLNDAGDEARTVQADNVHLMDQNERLQYRLGQLEDKYGNIASSKTDLSQQLLMTEEEKLKVSQSLVDIQIENNRIKEEAEATKFELTNKIFQLEDQLIKSESEREKQSTLARNAIERLTDVENERKDLADEYVTVKTNYLAVMKEHQKEVSRNEELSMELLNLVNAKATLTNQLRVMNAADKALLDPTLEVRRIRSMIGRHTPKRHIQLREEDIQLKRNTSQLKQGCTDDIKASRQEREHVEQSLFGSERRYEGEISRIHNMYDENTRKLGQKITSLGRELTETRRQARDHQHQLSHYNAKIIVAENERAKLETMYNRIQHKVKDLNEEYRSRLIKYVQDIAAYVDKENKASRTPQQWQTYIERMVVDVKKSFKQREEQLSQAAKQFKERLGESLRKYEEILTAYIQIKEKLEVSGVTVDGHLPNETTWKVNEPELQSREQQEMRRLKHDLNTALTELDSVKSQIGVNMDNPKDQHTYSDRGDGRNWSSLRTQLREFTLNTQQELERERAELLTENKILSEQLKQNQDYIDVHLVRYKEEIVRLRKKLGLNPNAVVTSALTLH